ncbi:MAG TPA: hypothetical protein VG994_05920 [Steroidobacteraceae bacterium]|nr:hypothetical protein [Steroidobacteraceae bacterium]
MSPKQSRSVALATVWLASTVAWPVAHADPLRDRIQACAANRDDAARLRCFDELATALPPEKAAEPAPSARASRPPRPEIQTARIVSVSQPDGRKYRVVLDNDEVWQETEHVFDMDLEPGQTVRIKPGAFGSFFLIAESGRSTRVRQVR